MHHCLLVAAEHVLQPGLDSGLDRFDLVLQQATYIRPGMDITDQVLKEMAKRGGGKP